MRPYFLQTGCSQKSSDGSCNAPVLTSVFLPSAPFLYLKDRNGFTVADVFHCFQAFVNRFLSAMFCDDEFTSLQCAFHLFKHLLTYHDPALSEFLGKDSSIPLHYRSGKLKFRRGMSQSACIATYSLLSRTGQQLLVLLLKKSFSRSGPTRTRRIAQSHYAPVGS